MKRNLFGLGCALVLSGFVTVATTAAQDARKDCEELKKEIAAKIEANGVKDYELNIVTTEESADQESKGFKVVGSCDAGTKKIVYKKS